MLPAHQAAEKPDPFEDVPGGFERKLRVVVVDDILMNRDIAGSFLESAGHSTICVESGPEAIAAVRMMDFDVVLMDIRMPEMSGLEAARHIRAIVGARGQVAIVALTAHAFAEQIQECHDAGMDFHLAKPFDAATLVATVEKAVRSHGFGGIEPPVAASCTGPQAGAGASGRAPQDTAFDFDPSRFEQSITALAPEVSRHFRIHAVIDSGARLRGELAHRDPGFTGNQKRSLRCCRKHVAPVDALHRGPSAFFGKNIVSQAARTVMWFFHSPEGSPPVLLSGREGLQKVLF